MSGKSVEVKNGAFSLEPEVLLSTLSFSHFIELLNIKEPLKRSFYEIQTVRNNWGARELGRAINTMLYERTGLSKDKPAEFPKLRSGQLLVFSEIN